MLLLTTHLSDASVFSQLGLALGSDGSGAEVIAWSVGIVMMRHGGFWRSSCGFIYLHTRCMIVLMFMSVYLFSCGIDFGAWFLI